MSTENTQSFDAMGLSPEILQGLTDLKFDTPTPIQSQAIPYILSGSNDLLGFAQTGTGKTAAFSLPIIQKIDPAKRHVQAIILCPTRELCMQITKDIKHFAKHIPSVTSVAIYGGSSMYLQVRKLQEGAQIVVGTPGRVKDLITRGKLNLGSVRWLVLDEADDMLDKGFKDDLDAILDGTPSEKQTLLFSATMSPWIKKVAEKRMQNPKEIRVSQQNEGADNVLHKYVTVHAQNRYAALRRLLDVNPDVYGIVFCRTRRQTTEVAGKLIADNYSAEAIHGDISQDERTETMARFREKHVRILVATDVAARGIDVNDLTHVINYELPDSPEVYVHRSGRTGRAGKTGESLTIIHLRERGKLKRIESIMRKRFSEINVPTGKEICKVQLMSLIHKVKMTEVDSENLRPFLPEIYQELAGMTCEDLINHFVSVEFNQLLKFYSDSKDIATERGYSGHEQSYGGGRDRRGREGGRDRGGARGGRKEFGGGNGGRNTRFNKPDVKLSSYEINFGRNDGFNPKSLFEMINGNQDLRGIEIGGIHVNPSSTRFEADARYHEKTLRVLGSETFHKKPVRISTV